ncbi:MAG: Saccharopine dehydrogenase, partial [Pelosinus sp.]|nr:Saccharopine dehydrogenase [Pelosinus sp.]
LLDTMGLPTEINEAPVAFTPPIIESLESV